MQFKDTEHIENTLEEYKFKDKLDKKIRQLIPEEEQEVYDSLNIYTYKSMIKILQKETTVQKLDKEFEQFFQEDEIEQKDKLISWIKNTTEQLYQKVKRLEQKRKRSTDQEEIALQQEKRQTQQKQVKQNQDKQEHSAHKNHSHHHQQNEEQEYDNGTSNGNIMDRIKKMQQQKTLQISKPVIELSKNNAIKNYKDLKNIQIPNKREQQNQKFVNKQNNQIEKYQNQQEQDQEQNTAGNEQGQQSEQQKTSQEIDEAKKKIKCKYYPNCKNQTTCVYHHPTEDCTHFPSCKFGASCLNKHPACNYGVRCTRMDCFYEHPPGVKRNQGYNPAMQMYNPFPYKQMMMPMGGVRRKPPSKVKMATGPQKKSSQEITTK